MNMCVCVSFAVKYFAMTIYQIYFEQAKKTTTNKHCTFKIIIAFLFVFRLIAYKIVTVISDHHRTRLTVSFRLVVVQPSM